MHLPGSYARQSVGSFARQSVGSYARQSVELPPSGDGSYVVERPPSGDGSYVGDRMWLALAFISMLFAIGCGGSTGKVQGVVTLDGNPVTTGTVLFHPSDNPRDAAAVATLSATGQYELLAAGGSAQVPIGAYRVSVHPGDGSEEEASSKSPLPTRYGNPDTSGLTADVKPGDNQIDFPLQTTEAP